MHPDKKTLDKRKMPFPDTYVTANQLRIFVKVLRIFMLKLTEKTKIKKKYFII